MTIMIIIGSLSLTDPFGDAVQCDGRSPVGIFACGFIFVFFRRVRFFQPVEMGFCAQEAQFYYLGQGGPRLHCLKKIFAEFSRLMGNSLPVIQVESFLVLTPFLYIAGRPPNLILHGFEFCLNVSGNRRKLSD